MSKRQGPPLRTALANVGNPTKRLKLIAIVVGLERTFGRHADIARLLVAELRELDAELVEVKPRDLLVEVLRKHVDLVLVMLRTGEQLDLRKHLVGEARAHDEARMARRVAEV